MTANAEAREPRERLIRCDSGADGKVRMEEDAKNAEEKTDDIQCDAAFLACLQKLKKGAILPVDGYEIKEGETTPPKR